MWPWGHLAAGYLVYRLGRRPLDGLAVLALVVGTQIPDLIDKPLAWTIPLLPNGRSLSHSLLIVPPLLLVVAYLASGRRHRVVVALTVGYLAHLATDGLYPLIEGEIYYLGFLGWPLIPPIEYEGATQGILAHFLTFQLTPRSGFEILLFGIAILAWVLDGKPGYREIVWTAKSVVDKTRQAVSGS
jgi:hypothetical protein